MDLSVLQRFSNFKLVTKEEKGLFLDQKDIQSNREECSRSLIGKIYREKLANYTGIRNTLATMWSSIVPFKLREMGVNLYQFVFANQ